MAISATTALCGIVLHPASHTRSPAMHNAAYAARSIDAAYLAFDVPPDRLGQAISGARALGIRQLAVSIPHKQAVVEYLDEIDETARAIGAVNTVSLVNGRLVGANTDWLGAVQALEGTGPLPGVNAAVLGAGGTARAVTFGLLRRGARVTVLNRTEARARTLATELGAQASGSLSDLGDCEYEVLVNTTSVGLNEDRSPAPAAALRPGSRILDAVYSPPETRLLRDARSAGATPIEGKWMLIHQAAAQFEIWTGQPAPIEAMARAFDEAGDSPP